MVLLHLDAFVGQNLTFSHQISVQLKTSEHFRAHFFVFRAQFLTKRRHFRPDPFLSCAERWQDLRAVHDSRGPCSEKGPFLARSPRGVFPNGCLRGISDAWRAYLAKASPFSDAWRANLAANWRFSRPRPLSGCMERKTCHGLTPRERTAAESCHGKALENAPRENIATASQAKGASGRNPATVGRWGTHFESILPSSSARERTVVKSCHYQSPENAFRAYPAIAGCLGMHSVDILPSADIRECAVSAYLHCRSSGCAAFSTRGNGFSPLAVLWGSARQHFLCEGVGIPSSRGLTAGNDFESALFGGQP